jgi:hypothetical protein
MRQVDVSVGIAKLRHALQTLRVRWESTQEEWNDQVSRHFEETYVAPLEPRVLSTLHAMSALTQVLAKAQQDCE